MELSAFHAIVHGRVQGVCFRYYTREEALRLGLVGWVRNLQDGTVELVAEGEKGALEALEAWIGRGPSMARVDRVDLEWRPAAENFATFAINY
jgi:acylphosphatase